MRRKLTDDQIQRMREARARGTAQADLAAEFGISQQLVSVVIRGDRFGDAGGPIEKSRRHFRRRL